MQQLILKSLSVQDLLKCAEVSKSWRAIVGNYLSHTNVYALIFKNCKNICKLGKLLKSTSCSLITAIKVEIPWEHSTCGYDLTEKEAKVICKTFGKLTLRALEFSVGSCDAADLLLNQILLNAHETLEELTLTYCVSFVHVCKLFLPLIQLRPS